MMTTTNPSASNHPLGTTTPSTSSTPIHHPQHMHQHINSIPSNPASDHNQRSNHPHHPSRFTRFLSKFTTSSIHSKRKSSLPNLNVHHRITQSNPFDSLPSSSKRTLSHPDSLHPNLKSASFSSSSSAAVRNGIDPSSLQPLLPLPTILDRTSSSFDQVAPFDHSHSSEGGDHTDLEDGADPNASIRPLTPSSKAVSITSPHHEASTVLTDPSSIDPVEQHSPTDSRRSDSRFRRQLKRSSSSSSSYEPDDCRSMFGNSSLASTKPTTVISLENGPGNRIAQPHPSPSANSTMAQPTISRNFWNRTMSISHHQHHHHHRQQQQQHHHHQRLRSSGSSSFNANPPLNQSPQQQQQQPTTPTLTLLSSAPVSPQAHFPIVNVPTHSLPHPSQNPHPAALADNASILTLASSGFSPSLHHQQNFPSDDASVRALAPSRRESIESITSSRWSQVKSHRTGGSIRTTGTGFFIGINNPPSLSHDDSLEGGGGSITATADLIASSEAGTPSVSSPLPPPSPMVISLMNDDNHHHDVSLQRSNKISSSDQQSREEETSPNDDRIDRNLIPLLIHESLLGDKKDDQPFSSGLLEEPISSITPGDHLATTTISLTTTTPPLPLSPTAATTTTTTDSMAPCDHSKSSSEVDRIQQIIPIDHLSSSYPQTETLDLKDLNHSTDRVLVSS